jgi:hypothetical protein
MEVILPPCSSSSNPQISKDIYAFLKKQGNYIPISFIQNNHYSQTGGGIYDYFSRWMNGNQANTPNTSFNTNSSDTNNTDTYTSDTNTSNTNTSDTNSSSDINTSDTNTSDKEKTTNNNSILLEFHNKKHTLENIKGTKLFFLISRNGNNECPRWI